MQDKSLSFQLDKRFSSGQLGSLLSEPQVRLFNIPQTPGDYFRSHNAANISTNYASRPTNYCTEPRIDFPTAPICQIRHIPRISSQNPVPRVTPLYLQGEGK